MYVLSLFISFSLSSWMDWFILIAFVMTRCAALKIFHVLPDNSANISCQSQSCGTLNQYVLNNNTLPTVPMLNTTSYLVNITLMLAYK